LQVLYITSFIPLAAFPAHHLFPVTKSTVKNNCSWSDNCSTFLLSLYASLAGASVGEPTAVRPHRERPTTAWYSTSRTRANSMIPSKVDIGLHLFAYNLMNLTVEVMGLVTGYWYWSVTVK